MAARIEDYALIGDCRTAALVSREGSIDWFCVPRFDSDACFAALLGTPGNGRWRIAPKGRAKIERAYCGESLILETEFTTRTGRIKLIDFMPPNTRQSDIVRIIVGLAGKVTMETDLAIRFDYGVTIPWVSRVDRKTLTAVAGPHMLALRTPVSLHGVNMHSVGHFIVRKGDRIPFTLSYSPSHLPVPAAIDPDIALDETTRFWAGWSSVCKIEGKWRTRIMRSLVTLKSLSYRPTGGIVAAVTTSLPEQIGGPRNWDYRYCWLRDATFTLLAFMNAGYMEEANVWQNWLLRAIAGAPDQLQTMYGVAGEKRLDELELPLPGYENSRPVRIGNAAAKQLQLDIYGELADVMAQAARGGLPPAPRRAEIRAAFLSHLEKAWRLADEGIWEIRGTPLQFTHSKVMAWVAFDRASRARTADAAARRHWKKVAAEIHADVCAHAVDPEKGCFVQSYGSTHLDASLLLMAIVGFLPASDKRIRCTVEEIEKRLVFDGLVLRYESETGVDGLPAGEGAFLACSFWLVDNYILLGRARDARILFGKLAKLANDVGLLAEEYDPRAKRMLGNFPQAFSHVALINAAINLMHEDEKQKKKKSERKPVVTRDRN